MTEEATRRTVRRVGAVLAVLLSAIAVGTGGLARPVGFLTLVGAVGYRRATLYVALGLPTPVDPAE